jgi:hypothetical protein
LPAVYGFFNRVEQDGFALTGGPINDPENIWIFYIDAENACGQVGGAGGAGRVVVSRDDLEGMLSGRPYNRCGAFFNFPIERWIGGSGARARTRAGPAASSGVRSGPALLRQ